MPTESAAIVSSLIPGQAVRAASLNASAKEFLPQTDEKPRNRNNHKNTKRTRNPNNKKKNNKNNTTNNDNNNEPKQHAVKQSSNPKKNQPKEKTNKINTSKKEKNGDDKKQLNKDHTISNTDDLKKKDEKVNDDVKQEKKKSSRTRNNRNRKENRRKYPWRKFIPNDSVDPISLEPLNKLTYPPFALCISPPYILIDEESWWKNENDDTTTTTTIKNKNDDEERQATILQQQWGTKVYDVNNTIQREGKQQQQQQQPKNESKNYHLFDGKCLAYYIVSTCQFIDPFNRRDLTKEEVRHLDRYMKKYEGKSQLYEMFIEQGTPTLNSAGIASQTQQGRTQLLQQEASLLLQSLYSTNNNTQRRNRQIRRQNNYANATFTTTTTPSTSVPPPRQEMVISIQREDNPNTDNDIGIYTQEGMVMIDDDDNPGLRGGLSATTEEDARMESRQGRQQAVAFPSLSSTNTNTNTDMTTSTEGQTVSNNANNKNSRLKKTLSNMVKKTNPKEIEKQKRARDEAQQRAALAQMSFQPYGGTATTTYTEITSTEDSSITSGQLDRNQMVASALGIPTVKNAAALTGWARPIDGGSEVEYDLEFVKMVKENGALEKEVLKMERKWLTFLQSSTDASLSLRPMDRTLRIFVHAYSNYWNLQTQSYDKEPKRYIHCAKLRDTRAPNPLLSTYMQKKLYLKKVATTTINHDLDEKMRRVFSSNNLPQNKISHSFSRELLQTEERKPLILHPPSSNDLKAMDSSDDNTVPPTVAPPPGAMFFAQGNNGGRFAMLERERPKLHLAPRTLPFPDTNEARKISKQTTTKVRKIRQPSKQKKPQPQQSLLLNAAFFDSDDDNASDDSDWDVGKAMYSGSDED